MLTFFSAFHKSLISPSVEQYSLPSADSADSDVSDYHCRAFIPRPTVSTLVTLDFNGQVADLTLPIVDPMLHARRHRDLRRRVKDSRTQLAA
jgi:hypothetical protein